MTDLGRVQLSDSFWFRDFLYSETASIHGLANVPDDPDLAIAVGTRLCVELLEPLQARFGRLAIRSSFRSAEVNACGNAAGENCADNDKNSARHIWDRPDKDGCIGAMSSVIVPAFARRFQGEDDWQKMAWWIHDHLPYSELEFFKPSFAFNIGWLDRPVRSITSFLHPRTLTRPGMANHDGSHRAEWAPLDVIKPVAIDLTSDGPTLPPSPGSRKG